MKIEPLKPHPIVKLKPVKNDNQRRRQKEEQQQKQQEYVEGQEDESNIQHIDEII